MLEPPSTHKRNFIAQLLSRASSRPPPSSSHFFAHQQQQPDLLDVLERALPFGLGLDTLFKIVAALVVAPLVYWFVSTLHQWRAEAPPKVNVPLPPAALAGWQGTILSSPSIQQASKPGQITCYDPSTAQHITDIPADTVAEIEAKVKLAEGAQKEWAGASWTRRRRVLRCIKRWCLDDMEGIARLACRDTGKTAVDAVLGELLTTLSKIDWLIGNSERVLKPEVRPSNLLLAHKRCEVHHIPLGVVAACVSWNYPVHNLLSPTLAALASGNSIVVKVSEQVAWSSRHVLTAIRACLIACGENPDLVQVVCCFPDAAEAVTANERIKHITFIGSESVAALVAKSAAKKMIPTCMELGGKDPMIILPSCDLDFFVPTWLRGAFGAAGQNCIGAERFIISRPLLPKLITLLEPRIRALKLGSFLDDTSFSGSSSTASNDTHVDVGALITGARIARLEELVNEAVKKGAKCVVGGRRFVHAKHTQGHYFAPTLIVDVTPDMQIAQEELFAPVFLVMAYDSVSEAVALANGTRYGLGSSVFGNDKRECFDVAARMEAGMVNINDFACGYLNQGLPFGGVKASGYGRFGGPEGLLSLTSPRAITSDLLFRFVRTSIPPPLDYPIRDAGKAWRFARGLALLAGGASVREQAWGLWGVIRNSL